MKLTYILIICLLTFNLSFACSCNYQTFISASKSSELVVKGKVLKHNYYNRQNQQVPKAEIDEAEFFGHSILIEVIEIVKGNEFQRTFEIYGGSEWKYAMDCTTKVEGIEVDNIYIFSLRKSAESKLKQPNEDKEDYTFYACQESYVQYNEETDSVKGVLKGKNLDKVREIPYKKLKRKIT